MTERDCSIPPKLFRCEVCGLGYATGTEHTTEDCAHARATQEAPCAKCGHGKHYHGEGFCVQAIAGHGAILPSFCGKCEYAEAPR